MESDIPKMIGKYTVLSQIGRGGMGEVFLVQDPDFKREIALKRIRPELMKHDLVKRRFLQEAQLTAQLTHPGIISIYSIQQDENSLYYLMPYIPGVTLKVLLRQAHEAPHSADSQISRLLPIFHSLCQTVAYAHSRGILHRDIKPENVLVGNFGEVILLDWGLAQRIADPENDEDIQIEEDNPELTSPGKMVGTVSYMAPERAQGVRSSIKTDIYALGVILYQILTLKFPFQRGSLKEFRKQWKNERMSEPEEAAPYRDVPPALSAVVKKCLAPNPKERFSSVNSLIEALDSHFAGNSSWFLSKTLRLHNKKDWQFHEHLMLTRHIAITGSADASEWFGVMYARTTFAEKMRLEATVTLKRESQGVGFILGAPDLKRAEQMMIGYSLWLGAKGHSCVQLYRNTVEVLRLPSLALEPGVPYQLVIERGSSLIRFKINGEEFHSHVSFVPLFGTHVGLIYKDMNFELDEINILVGSHDLEVSCLSVPDAFLASRDLKRALAEYRRISRAFPGRQEGRDASFRAGYTLLQQGKLDRAKGKGDKAFHAALDEFSNLHGTPGAPLEYLGKALVYQALNDPEEELKSIELGLRRYLHHPLIDALKEHVIFRMHQASQKERVITYRLIIIVLRIFPHILERPDCCRLFRQLIENWEPLPFLECSLAPTAIESGEAVEKFLIPLAFWTASPLLLEEIFIQILHKEEDEKGELLGDILFCLYELGAFATAKKLKSQGATLGLSADIFFLMDPLDTAIEKGLEEASKLFSSLGRDECGLREWRTLTFLMRQAIREKKTQIVHELAKWASEFSIPKQEKITIDAYVIWAALLEGDLKKVEEIFDLYPLELVNQETTLLHPLFGCWLFATEGYEIAAIHFNGVTETPFPRSFALLGHELTNEIQESPAWYQNAFMWEKRALYAQLSLYHKIEGRADMQAYYSHLEKTETFIRNS